MAAGDMGKGGRGKTSNIGERKDNVDDSKKRTSSKKVTSAKTR